jgi:hypothetical protein
MKSHTHTIFSITIAYNNSEFTTKALKYAYPNNEVLYKIALPSNISAVQQCWVSKNEAQWKQIMGPEADEKLLQGIINALQKYEHIPMIEPKVAVALKPALKLKSA